MSIVSWFNGISSVNGWLSNTVVTKTGTNSGVISQKCYLLENPDTNAQKLYNKSYITLNEGTHVRVLSEREFGGIKFYNVEYVLQQLPFTQNWLKLLVGISFGAFITVVLLTNKETNKKVKTRNDTVPIIKNPRKSLSEFVREHRDEIDQATGGYSHNDKDRRDWVMNDEGLYLWAKSEGVNI